MGNNESQPATNNNVSSTPQVAPSQNATAPKMASMGYGSGSNNSTWQQYMNLYGNQNASSGQHMAGLSSMSSMTAPSMNMAAPSMNMTAPSMNMATPSMNLPMQNTNTQSVSMNKTSTGFNPLSQQPHHSILPSQQSMPQLGRGPGIINVGDIPQHLRGEQRYDDNAFAKLISNAQSGGKKKKNKELDDASIYTVAEPQTIEADNDGSPLSSINDEEDEFPVEEPVNEEPVNDDSDVDGVEVGEGNDDMGGNGVSTIGMNNNDDDENMNTLSSVSNNLFGNAVDMSLYA